MKYIYFFFIEKRRVADGIDENVGVPGLNKNEGIEYGAFVPIVPIVFHVYLL